MLLLRGLAWFGRFTTRTQTSTPSPDAEPAENAERLRARSRPENIPWNIAWNVPGSAFSAGSESGDGVGLAWVRGFGLWGAEPGIAYRKAQTRCPGQSGSPYLPDEPGATDERQAHRGAHGPGRVPPRHRHGPFSPARRAVGTPHRALGAQRRGLGQRLLAHRRDEGPRAAALALRGRDRARVRHARAPRREGRA